MLAGNCFFQVSSEQSALEQGEIIGNLAICTVLYMYSTCLLTLVLEWYAFTFAGISGWNVNTIDFHTFLIINNKWCNLTLCMVLFISVRIIGESLVYKVKICLFFRTSTIYMQSSWKMFCLRKTKVWYFNIQLVIWTFQHK